MAKETYMIIDTDFSTFEFSDIKEAEKHYIESVKEVIKDSSRFDGEIKFLTVTDRFTEKNLNDYQETTLEVVAESLSFKQPKQG